MIVIFKDAECNVKAVDVAVCKHTVLVVICLAIDAFALFIDDLVAVVPDVAFNVFFCIGGDCLGIMD